VARGSALGGSVPLEVLVGAPFEWQEGWLYELTGDAESTASRSEET
jgi:hypothetical protein